MYQGKYFTKEQLDMMKNYYVQYDEYLVKHTNLKSNSLTFMKLNQLRKPINCTKTGF